MDKVFIMNEINVLEYITQTANATPKYIEPVRGGLTKVVKCKTEICGQAFMVKILPGNPTRDLWYAELNKRSNNQMANPKMHKLFSDGTLCLLSPWIEGECLEKQLQFAGKKQIDEYTAQAAHLLLQLHNIPVDYPAYQDNLNKRIKSLCSKVENNSLSFPGKEVICNYLLNETEKHTADHVCLVHRDIRPENFVVKDKNIYLIDFDNGSLGERASDFPYLTTMVWPEHYVFANKLIEIYLSKIDADYFWQTNLLYSAIQLVDYAIWKWETKQKQVFIQADNFMKQYKGLTSNIPAWLDDLEGK